ncbi:MAG: hypothetical protein OQK55_06425 [Thermoanaerobaculales bacterium]|nr:hypothetical protein [Thermoanaerobaculales bacterium]
MLDARSTHPPAESSEARARFSEVPGSHIVDVLIGNVACLASSREGH